MERRRKSGKKRIWGILSMVSGVVLCGALLVPWVMRPENFREQKDALRVFLSQMVQEEPYTEDFYHAQSLLVVDRGRDEVFIFKKAEEPQLPASLAKLFVVEYASSVADLGSIVSAHPEAIALTKPGSSVAGIEPREYFLHNLLAAMLVPSGNDAAYVVADYCGGILSPQSGTVQERVHAFMDGLNAHLQENGYQGTVLYDPSGFDADARTTVSDLSAVVDCLLEYEWFRDIVAQSTYTAVLPDGSAQMWRNTNAFLNVSSEYYNQRVTGIKTGSLGDDYNLVVLYEQYGREFLICSLGSSSNGSRYDDVAYIIRTIEESDYLAG